ncbi:MAG: serine/threonine-protein kinase [Cyanobacteria bacterium P01_A01_bin.114]
MQSNYRRLGPVGYGQFGRVYCAMHRQTGEIVALKVLNQLPLPTHTFLHELSDRLTLDHPNIVICKALEQTNEGHQLALEYCEAGTLRSVMGRTSQFELADVVQLVSDVLTGLAYVHRQGVIHCDIKPENILLRYQHGQRIAKISDFGIARLVPESQVSVGAPGAAAGQISAGEQFGVSQAGAAQIGSPAYMAPEQFQDLYSPASDIYAVGVLLFELLSGQRPFSGTPAELMSAHFNQLPPVPATLPKSLQSLVLTALEKCPDNRYSSAEQMLMALQKIPSQPWLSASSSSSATFSGKVLNRFTQPVKFFWVGPGDSSGGGNRLYVAHPEYLAMAHLGTAQLDFHQMAPLPMPPRALVGTPHTTSPEHVWVVLDDGLYGMSVEPPCHLTPIAQFGQPSRVAIARRWWASLAPGDDGWQLTVGPLKAALPWLNRPLSLPPDFDVQQLLAIDNSHLLVVGQPCRHHTPLRLLTRRGHLLGRFDVGLSVRSLTPTPQPFRFLCRSDEVGAVILDIKPIRVIPLTIKIQPRFMASVTWGYLFLDTQGQLTLIDRDYQPLGKIQGPPNPTAIGAVKDDELLVATWNPTQADPGELYGLDLKSLGLDILF